MSRFERWLIHLSNLAVVGTGLVYTLMLFGLESDDPFSVVNHPLQPQTQHLHVMVAPLFVFAVGLIWRRHIWGHWSGRKPQSRRSGVSLLFLLAPMVASGYLLQISVDPSWRGVWSIVHLLTGGLWVLAFAGHYLSARRLAAKTSGTPAMGREA